MSKDVIQPKAEINLLELMQHHDDIHAALLELLFPCAHCGGKAEIRSGYSFQQSNRHQSKRYALRMIHSSYQFNRQPDLLNKSFLFVSRNSF